MNKQLVNCSKIIDNLDNLQEECAELISTCGKVKRAYRHRYVSTVGIKDYERNLVEEIIDVKNCIDAIMSVMNIKQEDIDKIAEFKSNCVLDTLRIMTNSSEK